jgi:hypothetical protein
MTVECQEYEIQWRGRRLRVPSLTVRNSRIIIPREWLGIAYVHDEDWCEDEVQLDPDHYVARIRRDSTKANLFTFTQSLPNTKPLPDYYFEWDNVAAIPLSSYDDWWNNRLSRKTRQEVCRAKRFGVETATVPFTDGLIRDIATLFQQIPKKQGRTFSHFRKDESTLRNELSAFIERSEFIGAYVGKTLIGYIKLVLTSNRAGIMNLVTADQYYDLRPGNALLAHAIQSCCARKLQFLVYGKYQYGNKASSSMAEFKRRNGFEKVEIPRYYVPLNIKGVIIQRLRLHRRLLGLLPPWVISSFVLVRAAIDRLRALHGRLAQR